MLRRMLKTRSNAPLTLTTAKSFINFEEGRVVEKLDENDMLDETFSLVSHVA